MVENALDAGARSVEVRVDVSRWLIAVLDDGRGIASADLRDLGTVRNCTSKRPRAGVFGFRGEALHSICTLGAVEIKTRNACSPLTSTKLVSRGQTVAVTVDSSRDSDGTSVIVRDLFSDWPVRRQSLKPALQLSRLRDSLQRLALLNYDTAFQLVDLERQRPLWGVRVVPDLASRARELLGPLQFYPVSCERGQMKVTGLLWHTECARPTHEVFVNKRPLPPSSDLMQAAVSRAELFVIGDGKAPLSRKGRGVSVPVTS